MASAGDVSKGDFSVYRLDRDDVSGIGEVINGRMVSAMIVIRWDTEYHVLGTCRSATRSRSSVDWNS